MLHRFRSGQRTGSFCRTFVRVVDCCVCFLGRGQAWVQHVAHGVRAVVWVLRCVRSCVLWRILR